MKELESKITDVTKRLLDDYEGGRTIDEIKLFDHPDEEILVDIIGNLRKMIFPGYFRNKSFRVYTVRNNISMLLEDVLFKLSKVSYVMKVVRSFNSPFVVSARRYTSINSFVSLGIS